MIRWAFACVSLLMANVVDCQTLVVNGSTDVKIDAGLDVIIQGGLENRGNGFIYNSGTLFINDSITNKSNTTLFPRTNEGTVQLNSQKKFQYIGGDTLIVFNNIVCRAGKEKVLTNNIHILGYLTLNNAVLQTLRSNAWVMNTDPAAVSRELGYVASDSGGRFYRAMDRAEDYLFPVGSQMIPVNYQPVSIRPNSASNDTVGIRLANYSASFDGYNIGKFDAKIKELNGDYYHQINRISGTEPLDLMFMRDIGVAHPWQTVAQWDKTEMRWKDRGPAEQNGNMLTLRRFNNFSHHAFILGTTTPEDLTSGLFIPTGFSPNADANNDTWNIKGRNVKDFKVKVWNRWGDVIFESDDLNKDWDGKFNGEVVPEGAYVFEAEANGVFFEDRIKQRGTITIIR